MTTLHDQLRDLADEAPASLPAPGLWERGLRYRRVRRTGTLAVLGAAVLVLALLGGITWHRAAPPVQPASGSVGLPDRVWNPSPWLPATDRPGRLVALTTADRGGWTGMRSGVVGVSASTGDYTFLELPDAALDVGEAPVLAPDGRRVAYWLIGGTSGTPLTRSGPVTGLAVLDTETGTVTRQWIRTAHGLSPDFLVWADGDTVVYSAGQVRGGDDASAMDQSSSGLGTVTSWSPGSEPRPVRGVPDASWLDGAAHGRIVVDAGSFRHPRGNLLVDVAGRSRPRHLDFPSVPGSFNGVMPVALDPTAHRIALVPGRRMPHRVQAGPVGDLREVPNTRDTWGVLDWLDPDTIVTLRRTRDRAEVGSALYRVSVSTGESRELVRFPPMTFGGGWQFATDLLDAPSVHAERPPRPLDPRWTTGLGIATILAAAGGVVLWRRRVQP